MGHPMASYALGTWYLHGYGEAIDCDFVKGGRLPKAWCERRHTGRAPTILPRARRGGRRGRRDDATAFEYYLCAALRGDAVSVNSVGTCYFYGIGVPEDRRSRGDLARPAGRARDVPCRGFGRHDGAVLANHTLR